MSIEANVSGNLSDWIDAEYVNINKEITINSILGQNKAKEEFSIEINKLREKLKKAQEALK